MEWVFIGLGGLVGAAFLGGFAYIAWAFSVPSAPSYPPEHYSRLQ